MCWGLEGSEESSFVAYFGCAQLTSIAYLFLDIAMGVRGPIRKESNTDQLLLPITKQPNQFRNSSNLISRAKINQTKHLEQYGNFRAREPTSTDIMQLLYY
jgi:hypothetical protein